MFNLENTVMGKASENREKPFHFQGTLNYYAKCYIVLHLTKNGMTHVYTHIHRHVKEAFYDLLLAAG